MWVSSTFLLHLSLIVPQRRSTIGQESLETQIHDIRSNVTEAEVEMSAFSECFCVCVCVGVRGGWEGMFFSLRSKYVLQVNRKLFFLSNDLSLTFC